MMRERLRVARQETSAHQGSGKPNPCHIMVAFFLCTYQPFIEVGVEQYNFWITYQKHLQFNRLNFLLELTVPVYTPVNQGTLENIYLDK